MLKLSANISTMFRELPFLDRIDAAASAGFEWIECQFPYDVAAEAVAARLARTGLPLTLFNIPAVSFGCAAKADGFKQLKRSVETALNYAEATGTRRLHLLSGCADRCDETAAKAYERSLHWASEQLDKVGCMLLIEPLNGRDVPGYYLNDYPYAEALIARLDLPNLRLQFDIYHRQILHGDVVTALRRTIELIGHVQIASVPDRHEPGSGELNDIRVLRELDCLGYAGFVGCEYVPSGPTSNSLAWRDVLLGTSVEPPAFSDAP